MIAPFQENYSKRTVALDELKRNTKRRNFAGLQVRVPLLLTVKQGTGAFGETAGPNIARQLDDRAAFIPLARVGHAIELSPDLMMASKSSDFVAAGDALKLHMGQAEVAMSRMENEMILGTGDGLLATITTGAASATQTVGTAANFYQLYPGRIVDILLKSNGTVLSAARTILSNDPVAGTVTFDASFTSVGATHGIYMEGTYGNAIQGLRQVFSTTGTFEGIDRATVPQWRGIEGRGTSPAAADLSIAIMDGAYRRVRASSGKTPDFWLADPASADKFSQSLLQQFRWDVKYTRLATGWEGIDYRGVPIIPEDDMPPGELLGVNKSAVTFYGMGNGPDWDDLTGSKFQRFNRNQPVEAWLIDRVQLGVHEPNALVRVPALNQAV